MDRLAEVAASKELQVYQSRSLGPPAAFPLGTAAGGRFRYS